MLVDVFTDLTTTLRNHPLVLVLIQTSQQLIDLVLAVSSLPPKSPTHNDQTQSALPLDIMTHLLFIDPSRLLEVSHNIIPTSARHCLGKALNGVRALTSTKVPRLARIHVILLNKSRHLHFEFFTVIQNF